MTLRVLAATFLLVLLPLAALPVGGALPGLGGGFTGTRLEGESYDRSLSYCDSFDGERAFVGEWENSSNGRYAFLPGTYCGIEYTSIAFPGAGRFTTARVIVQAPLGTTGSLRLNVHVDDELASTVAFSFSDTARIQLLTLQSTEVRDGAHKVVLSYSGSPYWVNLGIDYLDFEVVDRVPDDPPCTNEPPVVTFSANGMVDGLVGWRYYGYMFNAQASDPDGDALDLVWKISNVTRGTSSSMSWAFQSVGAHVVEVTARERVDRCGTGQLSATARATFQVRGDWETRLTRPQAGTGCIETIPIPARLVVGYCEFEATVATGADAPAFQFDTWFLLDSQLVSRSSTPTFSYLYDSYMHRTGEHSVRACAREPTDVHGRTFCTDAYTFTSIGIG